MSISLHSRFYCYKKIISTNNMFKHTKQGVLPSNRNQQQVEDVVKKNLYFIFFLYFFLWTLISALKALPSLPYQSTRGAGTLEHSPETRRKTWKFKILHPSYKKVMFDHIYCQAPPPRSPSLISHYPPSTMELNILILTLFQNYL